MLKFDLRVKLGRVTSGAKIAVSAFNCIIKYTVNPNDSQGLAYVCCR